MEKTREAESNRQKKEKPGGVFLGRFTSTEHSLRLVPSARLSKRGRKGGRRTTARKEGKKRAGKINSLRLA